MYRDQAGQAECTFVSIPITLTMVGVKAARMLISGVHRFMLGHRIQTNLKSRPESVQLGDSRNGWDLRPTQHNIMPSSSKFASSTEPPADAHRVMKVRRVNT